MPSGDYSEDDVNVALRETGVNEGNLIYMPSALFALGKMADTPLREIPDRIYKAVRSVIGSEGTLTVPASFDDYARFGTPYDTRRSRVDPGQGALSQFVADLPTSFRSYCPLNAVAGIGPDAQEVCHGWTGASYGAGSAWDIFYERDATFLFLGIAPNQAFNYIYYIQQRFGVPHLYNKFYTVPDYEDGNSIDLPLTSAVRYLDGQYRIQKNVEKFEADLRQEGVIRHASLGRDTVYMMPSAREVFNEGIGKLRQDIFYFQAEPPAFVPGGQCDRQEENRPLPVRIKLGRW